MPKKQKWPPTKSEFNKGQKAIQELKEIRENQLIEPMLKEFSSMLLTLAASMPFDSWPLEFKLAFAKCREEQGYYNACDIYIKRLPGAS